MNRFLVLPLLLLREVPCCLGFFGADVVVPDKYSEHVSTSMRAKFWVLKPPPEYQKIGGRPIECTYFGHMYSFEYMYPDWFSLNPIWLAPTPEEADFVILEHCITYVYHILRYGSGFNTVKLSWEALRIVQEEYLLPIIRWAQEQPVYKRTMGRNFVIVLAMDKGRVDYPMVSDATKHWHAVTTVGNGTTWMRRNQPYLEPNASRFLPEGIDPCQGKTSTAQRPLIFYDQDIVVPVPTAFDWSEKAEQTESRDLLLFYAGSPNSCIRRKIVEELSGSIEADVLVIPKPIPRGTWSELIYRSRFCLVPDGFSSISARLYEVMLHGCVPVLFSHAFHPPFESLLNWRSLAIFLRNSEVTSAPALLRNISDETYSAMHREVVRAQALMSPHAIPFWVATNLELQLSKQKMSS
eukprot:TRINITY_DN39499_c0_g1_i1.p1 TRINITY_DN39499_c0_g1~~TRINITY_DN39499_c0_g1_i1.p1  ORF type:complete len:409 (+),score=36.92 TRINITY_DN39499_c0_g1_i1:89-1315(+)